MIISPSTLGEKTKHSLILMPEELIKEKKGTMLRQRQVHFYVNSIKT